MLQGEDGPARQLAMRILARMAPLYGAKSLLPVTQAHIDGVIYRGGWARLCRAPGSTWAARCRSRPRSTSCPWIVSVGGNWGRNADFASRARPVGQAYLRMGATPTFTCAPYQTAQAPKFGEQIAWSESNAVAFANSVIGARTNRYGDYLDVCCALTGRAPAAGLHLDEPRLATVVVELEQLPPGRCWNGTTSTLFSGYLLGPSSAGDRRPLSVSTPTRREDQLKALCAAAASSGALALFHLVGITPEAATLQRAFGGQRAAAHTSRSSRATCAQPAEQLYRRLPLLKSTSLPSAARIAAWPSAAVGRVDGRKAGRAWRRCLHHHQPCRARSSGADGRPRAAGTASAPESSADTCILVAPLVRRDAKLLMTNSAKYAHYAPGLLGLDVVFGSTEDCVESAVAGRVLSTKGHGQGDRQSEAKSIVAGAADADSALVTDEPLASGAGSTRDTGEIIDRHHPLSGMVAAGRVLVIPSGRGSCSGSGTLLEAIHNGTAPAAILLGSVDPIIGLGAILGDELYGHRLPVVVLSDPDHLPDRDRGSP